MRRRSIPRRGSCRLWSGGLPSPRRHPALAGVSAWYSGPEGRLPTCYSPVRHSCIAALVRLACIRHAAGVYPEPGSNSQCFCYIEAGLAADFVSWSSFSLNPVWSLFVLCPTSILLDWRITLFRIYSFLCMYWSSRSVFKERSYLRLIFGAC